MSVGLPDRALVVAALRGGDGPLDALARAWLPHVYRWCHRLGGPGVDAEDAAHEALLVMCRRIGQVTDPDGFPAWLFAICRNVLANYRRRAWLVRWVPGAILERASTAWGPDRTAEASQAARIVWDALETLPAPHREVLVLCELEERSATEAAALLGLPVGTVKSRLAAAKRSFSSAVRPFVDAAPAAQVS